MPLTYQPFAQAPELTQLSRELSHNVDSSERILSLAVGGALALLGASRRSLGGALLTLAGGALLWRGATGYCPLYDSLGINHRSAGVPGDRGIKVEKTIHILKPRAEVFAFWRNLENLPKFMNHVKSVRSLGKGRSHWEVRGPAGLVVEWDAEIINEHENEMIAWQSLPGAQVQNAGSVRFEDDGSGGTRLRVNLEFHPPAGAAGAAVARLFGESPEQQLDDDLARLRDHLEGRDAATGQVEPHRAKMIA